MATMILGAFPDRSNADAAIGELKREGVKQEDISLIAEGKDESFGQTVAEAAPTKAAKGGAAVGGAAGGVAGLIAGAITTAGLFVAGPFALLAGLGLTGLATATGGAVGALAGGLVGGLVGLGVPEDKAKHYDSVVKKGGVVLGAEDDDVSVSTLRRIFTDHQAEQVHTLEHQDFERDQ